MQMYGGTRKKCMEEQEKNVEKLLRRVYDFVNQGF